MQAGNSGRCGKETIMINTMSERQAAFVADMLAEIFADAPAGEADRILARNIDRGLFADRTATKASIDALIVKRDAVRVARRSAARVAGAGAAMVDIEPGYYAAEYQGVLRFYAFRAGKGRHAGRVFCNRFRSDYLDRVGAAEQAVIRAAIAADIAGTRKRFADEIGSCWRCARTLTDETSRELGIGPECRKVVGL
jgi:hypothetical protein